MPPGDALTELDENAFEALLRLGATDAAAASVSLENVSFFDPFGMLGVIALGRVRAGSAALVLPRSQDVLHYLVRMEFFSHLGGWRSVDGTPPDPAAVARRAESPVLLEITPVATSADVAGIVGRIRERLSLILSTQLGYSEIEIQRFTVAISELCQNIPDHARAEGLVAIQRYHSARGGGNVVKLAVVDVGVGIRESLRPRYAGARPVWDDATALLTSFEPGASRVDDPGRGQGLKRVREMVVEWRGRMMIRSGTAKAIVDGARTKGAVRSYTGLTPFPGTQVAIHLPQPAEKIKPV